MNKTLPIGRGVQLRWRILACSLCAALLGGASLVCAQSETSATNSTSGVERIRTRADSLNYDRKNNVVEGIGHVIIRKGDVILHADYVRVNTLTEEAEAQGNVKITRGEEEWTGDSVTYNFKTGQGATFGLAGSAEPFHLESDSVERTAEGNLLLKHARVTTCNNEPGRRHYHIRAREVEVEPNEIIKGRGTVWYVGRVPILYTPYWYKDLDNEFGWKFVPGQNSRMGTFLLSSYHYRINPSLRGETHLDTRTERGLAVGQDFKWNVNDVNQGTVQMYFADDQKPLDDDEDAATVDIDDSRYRIRFQDRHQFSDKDTVRIYGHKLSDTDVIEDFFDKEYRAERQPDNYVSYTHYEENYTVNALVRSRLDDFYGGVNRLPEVTLDIFRNQIGDS
ncbi:MAG: hypothetical protein O3C57_07635, partial [Verrucomicrobia bacterium]|nr:hypothetical protein [Verrucomicrobiota bacterium]